jgi:hypothetical protein
MPPGPADPARQRYLDFHAKCHQAFSPFAPIQLPDFFAGRLEVVRRVRRELEAPGRHVAIFGERGAGKTSLAELLYFFTPFAPDDVLSVRCGSESTFDVIFGELLTFAGADLGLETVEGESGVRGELAVRPFRLEGDRKQRRTYRALSSPQSVTKARLLRSFQDAGKLLVIDEYDRVEDRATHTRLAELIKAFSDSRSSTKVVLVGVADSLRELIGEHESLSRSLAQIKLERMSTDELADIIRRGEERIGLRFRTSVADRIVRLADGFPHFVHLIALHASLSAIEQMLERPELQVIEVGEAEYEQGVDEAIRSSEYTLIESYENAVISTRRKTDVYELILQAIAMGSESVAQVQDIARYASVLAGEPRTAAQLSTALGTLTREAKGGILTKVRDGYYKFSNPLMRAYVRLLLDRRYRGQLHLPFFQS